MIAGYGQNRIGDHGGSMIFIGLLMPRSFMLKLQIWMQLKVLMLLLNITSTSSNGNGSERPV